MMFMPFHHLQIFITLQPEFDTLKDQVTEVLVKSRSTYYKQGDKASKLLAHKLCQLSSHQIPKIRTSSGISLDPRGINDEFKRFYQSLYTSENEADVLELDNFFHSLAVPLVAIWLKN